MLGLRWLIWTRAVDDPSIQPLNLHLGSTVYDELSRVPPTLSATISPRTRTSRATTSRRLSPRKPKSCIRFADWAGYCSIRT